MLMLIFIAMKEMKNKCEKNIIYILKNLDQLTYKVDRHTFMADLFECSAIAISNKFDRHNSSAREARYLDIIKKYEKAEQNIIADMFAEICVLLLSMPDIGFYDYLGELYMRSDTSNSKAGQFFTHYSAAELSAKLAITPDIVNDHKEKGNILKIHEPACGSGGMILAAADILHNQYRFNYARNLFVECGDIDSRCVHMAYLQLGLAGIPAIIQKRDALTLEKWETWYTPAYLMQWLRFRRCAKE